MCKELGTQFRFPGTDWGYRSLQSATDIDLLCRAIVHLLEADAGANASFNIANGDVFGWSSLWPRVANTFGLEYGPPQRYSLLEYMADKEPVWQPIVKKHGLRIRVEGSRRLELRRLSLQQGGQRYLFARKAQSDGLSRCHGYGTSLHDRASADSR